jgi:hypothetical protein
MTKEKKNNSTKATANMPLIETVNKEDYDQEVAYSKQLANSLNEALDIGEQLKLENITHTAASRQVNRTLVESLVQERLDLLSRVARIDQRLVVLGVDLAQPITTSSHVMKLLGYEGPRS